MDSLIFDANQTEDLVRSTNPATGAVYRTTVGPKYYQYWDKLPKGTQVVSTLNLGNLTYEVARDLALASLQYAPTERILGLELGNEPNSYWNTTGANGGAQGYVNLWKNWTSMIDNEVNGYLGSKSASLPQRRWWASSATTDDTAVNLRPVSIIPDGVNSNGNIAEYSIHNYQWSTCDPNRTEIATIPNILNISAFGEYADTAIMPSGTAAVNAGNEWLIGEVRHTLKYVERQSLTILLFRAVQLDQLLRQGKRNRHGRASALAPNHNARLRSAQRKRNIPAPRRHPGATIEQSGEQRQHGGWQAFVLRVRLCLSDQHYCAR
jgi:hypothetical protein